MSHITQLSKLASLTSDLDMIKDMGNIAPFLLLEEARKTLTAMKFDSMDIGNLEALFALADSAASNNQRNTLREAIHALHCEIERLMGDEARNHYAPDDTAIPEAA